MGAKGNQLRILSERIVQFLAVGGPVIAVVTAQRGAFDHRMHGEEDRFVRVLRLSRRQIRLQPLQFLLFEPQPVIVIEQAEQNHMIAVDDRMVIAQLNLLGRRLVGIHPVAQNIFIGGRAMVMGLGFGLRGNAAPLISLIDFRIKQLMVSHIEQQLCLRQVDLPLAAAIIQKIAQVGDLRRCPVIGDVAVDNDRILIAFAQLRHRLFEFGRAQGTGSSLNVRV